MSIDNPIDLLFGGMDKLGPGGDAHTLNVLSVLPKQRFHVVVDAGCGVGRQTMVLAKQLGTLIHAVDSHQPFLNELTRRARHAGIDHLVRTHCLDMKDLPVVFHDIDLLWSEGAAYNIGFSNALTTWASALGPAGLVVVSELSWLREEIPDPVRDFFRSGYPAMRSLHHNVVTAEDAGYEVLHIYTLPAEAWVEGYYDVLEPRARALLGHPDAAVRDLAIETVKEIEAFRCAEGSYGYVFYVLRRVTGARSGSKAGT